MHDFLDHSCAKIKLHTVYLVQADWACKENKWLVFSLYNIIYPLREKTFVENWNTVPRPPPPLQSGGMLPASECPALVTSSWKAQESHARLSSRHSP